jgi:transcription initiation factor TFIIIB Brf1 subunit/transcription initiation factor TFIIB
MSRPEIEQEIERTRQRLGETVEELAAKADVKARVRDKTVGLSRRARQSQVVQRRWPLAVAAAGLVIAAAFWRRRRA